MSNCDRDGPSVTPMRPRPIVLIVEDDADIAELLVELTRSGGYEPQHAPTLAAALVAVRSDGPDLIVLDIALPDARGTQGLQRLASVRPDVPIIMVTGNTDETLARETLKRGAFDYVTKPFDTDHLARVLDTAVGAARFGVLVRDVRTEH
jgi:DNA-binding response OmpR family regulator